MAMTAAQLKENVEEITEMDFKVSQLNMFIKQVEQRIYGLIKDFPMLRKTYVVTVNPKNGLELPTDVIYIHSVTQRTGDDKLNRKSILQKNYDFLFEAYPETVKATDSGNPEVKYYALDGHGPNDDNQTASRFIMRFAPKWDSSVIFDIEYHYHIPSILDVQEGGEEPWLGTNYDTALLNGTLVEAAKFMKAEPDMVQMYEQQFVLALQQLQNTVDVKMKSDSFRPQKQMPKPIPMPQPTPEQQG